MIRKSELTKKYYRIGEVAEMVGRTRQTLINWDESGQLVFLRDPNNNYRYLTREMVIDVLKECDLYFDDTNFQKRDVIYARVSSNDQKKKGDLDRQILLLLQSTNDFQNVKVIQEVGSGLNNQRKGVMQLIDLILSDQVSRIFITYKDRLTRFGYHYLEQICKFHGVEICVLNPDSEKKTVEEELVDDVMSLIASFSGKLHRLRSSKNRNVLELYDVSKLGDPSEEILD